MNRRGLMAGLAATPALAATSVLAQPDSDDRAGVQAFLDTYLAGWIASDAEAMYQLAADDVEWVNVVGMYWRGKAQVVAAHHAYLTTIFRGVPLALSEIETIRRLGEGAVVAVVRWAVGEYVSPGGRAFPAAENRMTLMFSRTPDGPRLAHAANIEIVAAAAASDPVNGARAG